MKPCFVESIRTIFTFPKYRLFFHTVTLTASTILLSACLPLFLGSGAWDDDSNDGSSANNVDLSSEINVSNSFPVSHSFLSTSQILIDASNRLLAQIIESDTTFNTENKDCANTGNLTHTTNDANQNTQLDAGDSIKIMYNDCQQIVDEIKVGGKIALSIESLFNDGDATVVQGTIRLDNFSESIPNFNHKIVTTTFKVLYRYNAYGYEQTLSSIPDSNAEPPTVYYNRYYLNEYNIKKAIDYKTALYTIQIDGNLKNVTLGNQTISIETIQPLLGHNWTLPFQGEFRLTSTDGSVQQIMANRNGDSTQVEVILQSASTGEFTDPSSTAWDFYNDANMFEEPINANALSLKNASRSYNLYPHANARFAKSSDNLKKSGCPYCVAELKANEAFYIYLPRVPENPTVSATFIKGDISEGCPNGETFSANVSIDGAVLKVTPANLQANTEYCTQFSPANLKTSDGANINIGFSSAVRTMP